MRSFVANSMGRPKQKAFEKTEVIMFLLKKDTNMRLVIKIISYFVEFKQ